MIADVDHQLIHRHDPDDRLATTADQDVGTRAVRQCAEAARDAVGVPDRHRRDRGVVIEPVSPPVRHAAARRHPLDARYTGLQRHHGSEFPAPVVDAGAR